MRKEGFTLIELLLCVGLLLGLFVGMMSIYVYCFDLQETSKNTVIALNEARTKVEQIRNTAFDDIETNYNAKTFTLTTMDGIARTEAVLVTGSNNSLLDIRVIVCWRQKGGRIIGEAAVDGTGSLIFSDLDGDGNFESPVELVTAISKKI